MKSVTLALALFATGANAACVIPNFGTQHGIVPGDTNGCATNTILADGATCTVKCDTGYACDSGTTTFTCHASDTTLTAEATLTTTGCAVMYKQTDTKSVAVVAKTAADASTAASCTACNGAGEYAAAAVFGSAAGSCIACPSTVWATAGACALGCPADTFQDAGTNAATITCAECDKTKYLAVAASGVAGAPETAAANCGNKGCRKDYSQTSGAVVAAADCIETATKNDANAFCTAIDAIDTVQCNAVNSPANLAACQAVKKQNTDGTSGDTTDAACTFTAAVSGTTVGATATACDNAGVPANAAACTTANAGCEILAAIVAADPVCAPCAAGTVTQATSDQTGASNTARTCLPCNPYIAGACRTGCPANFWQSAGTSADGAGIKCTACAAGKTLTNTAALTAVQTADACTTPAATSGAAGALRLRAISTAFAASAAAAALM